MNTDSQTSFGESCFMISVTQLHRVLLWSEFLRELCFCRVTVFANRGEKNAKIKTPKTSLTTQWGSIYDYWTKIIASKSKTIAIATFAITNDTSRLIFFSKSIFRIFQITLNLLYNLQHVAIFKRLSQSTLCPYNSQTERVVKHCFTTRTSRTSRGLVCGLIVYTFHNLNDSWTIVSRPVRVARVVRSKSP